MADFLKNFKNQNYENGFLSQKVLDTIAEKYDNKIEYRLSADGNYYRMVPKETVKMTIENIKVTNIEDIENICNKKKMTFKEILEYSYNAQKEIVFEKLENYRQLVDNIEVDDKDLFISKKIPAEIISEKIIMFPMKMNERIVLNIGNGKESFDFTFVRKPIESLYKRKYVIDENEKLIMDLIIDTDMKNSKEIEIKFNITLNNKNIASAQDYLNSLLLMQSFFKDGMCIENKKINIKDRIDKNYYNRENLIDLWKKIVEIEKRL
ncbi:MAG: hypothetical protein LUG12_12700, partial [Erysipelotrichaceae bacterium]|nr:hypothetical protein [Erysipelotrichaceae bacterium]